MFYSREEIERLCAMPLSERACDDTIDYDLIYHPAPQKATYGTPHQGWLNGGKIRIPCEPPSVTPPSHDAPPLDRVQLATLYCLLQQELHSMTDAPDALSLLAASEYTVMRLRTHGIIVIERGEQ